MRRPPGGTDDGCGDGNGDNYGDGLTVAIAMAMNRAMVIPANTWSREEETKREIGDHYLLASRMAGC